MFKKTLLILLVFTLFPVLSVASSFTIEKLKVEGNERISFETINSYLPVRIGEVMSAEEAQKTIRALHKTGFFKDVSLWQRDKGVLVVKVMERPSIAEIEIEGNRLINTEEMNRALEGLGIRKGRIFNEAQMDRVIVDLRRRYQNQGYYAADVSINVEALPRNRVAVRVNIEEGSPATIGRITLVGNKTFSDSQLKNEMLLSASVLTGDGDKYSKPKLQSDLETIKSYYMDRGFAEFRIRSSQVSLSLDKTKVFITINLEEGPQYRISNIKFSGETILKKEELKELLKIQEGDLFNRSAVISTVAELRDKLSEEAFAFAEIEPITNIDRENRLIEIDFRIDPKNRIYIRRIIVEGNTRTRDHVIRREMRQFEAAPYSLSSIRRSNSRLNGLGYFKTANIETRRVAKDKVDLIVSVEEQPTGSFNAGLGYSQLDGGSFQVGVTERNLIGSGHSVSFNSRYSSSTQSLDLNITNPYFTNDGASLGGGIYFRNVDAEELGVADYSINNLGARMNLGYPLSEYTHISYGLKLDSQELLCNPAFTACTDYTREHGKRYDSARISVGWNSNTKNAFHFPTEGRLTSLSGEVSVPLDQSNVAFYKVHARDTLFVPLSDAFTLRLKGAVSYGDGLGSFEGLPFYERFYTGGIGSVRGYEANSLGPVYNLAQDGSNRPKGGRVEIVSTLALVFPMPMVDDSTNLRLSLFTDVGNVFSNVEDVKMKEMRASVGLGISWITPIGPLAFSLARPLNDKVGDRTQVFQFSLGIPM